MIIGVHSTSIIINIDLYAQKEITCKYTEYMT